MDKFARRHFNEKFRLYTEEMSASSFVDILNQADDSTDFVHLHNALDDFEDGPLKNVFKEQLIKKQYGFK